LRIKTATILIAVAIVTATSIALGHQSARAQVPAAGAPAADLSGLVSATTPPAAFTGRGAGSINVTSSCSLVTCNSGDTCFCYDFSSIQVTATTLGKVTLTGEISVDLNSFVNDGTGGFCQPSGGLATLTKPNGDQLNLKLGGHNCVFNGNTGGQFGEFGTYYATGGTGKLATKAATGNFSFFGPYVFGSQSTLISMSGVMK
jgi:hypothetical protein